MMLNSAFVGRRLGIAGATVVSLEVSAGKA